MRIIDENHNNSFKIRQKIEKNSIKGHSNYLHTLKNVYLAQIFYLMQ